MSELRQRQAASAPSKGKESMPQRPQQTEEDHGISVLDILRVLATIVLATFGISYYMTNGESVLFGYRPWYTRWPVVKQWIVSNSTFHCPSPSFRPENFFTLLYSCRKKAFTRKEPH
jgi:hypothetical protein